MNARPRLMWLATSLALTAGAALAYLPAVLSQQIPNAQLAALWTAIIAGLLWAAFTSRRSARFARFWGALYGLFAVAVAGMIDWLVPKTALPAALGVPPDSPAELAIMLFESTVIIVGTIMLLTRIAREPASSLLLKRGRVRVWLPIGVGAFVFFAVTALYAATNLFQGNDLSWGRVISWSPWIALFVFSNGLREELWFRGVMLPRFTPHIGATTAIVVSSLVFAIAHAGVNYTPVLLPFMGITLLLGLMFGTLAQRTDSLWGAVLFHAGADIPVVIGIMSNL